MGRGRIEIKRIENTTNRQVTFSKRKAGIVKKAREISVLCDAKVYLLVFSSSGKMADFCSDNTTLSSMLEQYQKHTGNRIWDAKHESLDAEIDRIKKENDSMEIELRLALEQIQIGGQPHSEQKQESERQIWEETLVPAVEEAGDAMGADEVVSTKTASWGRRLMRRGEQSGQQSLEVNVVASSKGRRREQGDPNGPAGAAASKTTLALIPC